VSAPEYVTKISVPVFGDNGVQRLHSRMSEPEPLPEPEPDPEACGPQFPTMQELWHAQQAPYAAHLAGCSDAEYDRLILERQQTEAAYLEGYDRGLMRDLQAEAAQDEPEAGL
jgi:hypothetical protein